MGVGARMSWASDHPKLGTGSEEIIESESFSLVKTAFDFGDEGVAESIFALQGADGGTRVTWSLSTDVGRNIVSRYFGLLFDGMMGPYFEQGLTNLKAFAEDLPGDDWSDLQIEIQELEPIPIAVTSGQAPHDDEAIGQALGAAYGAVTAFMKRNRLEQAGMPVAITGAWNDTEGWSFFAGIPVADPPATRPGPDDPVRIGQTPGGRTVVAEHVGPYGGLSTSYAKAHAYAAAYGLEQAGPEWEQFVSDPGQTPESELITLIFIPIR